MSHPPFGLKAGPTQFAPEKPTQPETTVIGSSAPVYALPTQPHPALIQAQNALVESTAESVAIPQTRYLIGLDKEIGGGFRKAAQKEFNNQCDGLIKTMTEFPVELKDSLNFSHIDLLFQGCSEEEYIGYILDAAGEYEGSSEESDGSGT